MSYLLAPRYGVTVSRRPDCARVFSCEDAWVDALVRTGRPIGEQAACPRKCSAFVRLGLREAAMGSGQGRVTLGG